MVSTSLVEVNYNFFTGAWLNLCIKLTVWNAAQGLVAMGVHMAVEVVGNHYLKKQPWQHATSRNKNQTGRIRRGIESWYSRPCKTAKWILKKIQDYGMKNHPKTRLWNLSQTLSWFQDRAKIFQDPRLLKNQSMPSPRITKRYFIILLTFT